MTSLAASRLRVLSPFVFALLLLFSISLLPTQTAYAAALVVNSTATAPDVNPADGICATAASVCTLQAAIDTANALGGGSNTITFDSTVFNVASTITINTTINANVTITGPGANLLTLKGGASATTSIFIVNGVNVTFSGATFSGGFSNNGGGAIRDNTITGSVTVRSSVFTANTSTAGGAIFSKAPLTIVNSTFSGNTGTIGGAVDSTGALKLINSTLSGNSSSGSAGGIVVDGGGTNLIANTTIASNKADSDATGGDFGGGIQTFSGVTLNVYNTLIAGNKVGPSTTDPTADCSGTFTAFSYNLVGSSTGCSTETHTVVVTPANVFTQVINALASNGGTTQTHALRIASPAVNMGNNTFALDENGNTLTTDQRGGSFSRTVSGPTDIGAYEHQTLVNLVVDRTTDLTMSPGQFYCTNTTADCSLADAITIANGWSGTNTITFNATIFNTPQTINITATINANMNIVGRGANLLTLNPAVNPGRILVITGGNVGITGITFANACCITVGNAIRSSGGGALTIRSSVFTGNQSGSGGAISTSGGALNIIGSTFSGNLSGGGGAIVTNAALTIIDSTFSGNISSNNGGAILLSGSGPNLISSSTFASNTADSDNNGSGTGGALLIDPSTPITVYNTIIAGNKVGTSSTAATADCDGAFTTFSNNLIGSGTGCSTEAHTIAVNPANVFTQVLNALGSNGGTTQTHALPIGSPAINGGNSLLLPADSFDIDGDANLSELLPLDQIGTARVSGTSMDVGAVELPVTTTSITTQPHSQTISSGQTASLSVTAAGTGLTYQWYIGTSGATGSPIAGATNSTYTTPALTVTTKYWVRVVGLGGSVNSNTATITISGSPPVDNPVVNVSSNAGPGDFNLSDGVCDSDSVTSGAQCTLRAAIDNANADAALDTITFDPTVFAAPQTLPVTIQLPAITGLLNINGLSTVTIDGSSGFRIFIIQSGATVNISTLTLTHSGGGSFGGAINNSGTLTVNGVAFLNNNANQGAGIYNAGTATVINSTFTGGFAADSGGAVYNFGSSTLTLDNSTLSGNSASANHGGGVYNNAGTTNLKNTIITGSTNGDCVSASGTVNVSHTLIKDGTCGVGAGPTYTNGNLSGDPLLNTLTGAPAYFPLQLTSPVINVGDNTLIPVGVTTDQAGNARVSGGIVDLGAAEAVCPAFPYTVPASDSNHLIFAITCANGLSSNDVINLTDHSTYTFAAVNNPTDNGNALPVIVDKSGAGTLTINGSSATITRSGADGVPNFRLFEVASGGDLTLNNLTLSNGHTLSGGVGGGALLNYGTLTVTGVQFSSSASEGSAGAFSNLGTATITGSSFTSNFTSVGGGAIGNAGQLTVIGSAFVNNTAITEGGALYNTGAGSVANSTFTGNNSYAGSSISARAFFTVTNSTLTGNVTDGADVFTGPGGSINLYNDILANLQTTFGHECSPGASVTLNHTLVEDGSCGTGSGSLTGDPLLGTQTGSPAYFPLSPSSPAFNAGDNTLIPVGITTDEANNPRINGGTVDLGAVEIACPTFPYTVPAGDTTNLIFAITCANALNSNDVINLINSNYSISAANNPTDGGNSLPLILDKTGAGTLTINGNGATVMRSAGTPNFRLFDIAIGGDLTLNNLTLANGLVSAEFGGALRNSGTVSLNNVTAFLNSADTGGAVYNLGTISITGGTISSNTASGSSGGGGLYNDTTGTMTLTNSVVTANTAPASGGGIINGGTLTLSSSTISANTSPTGNGGGILNLSTATIMKSTLSGNSAVLGGGIENGVGTLNVMNSTIASNYASSSGGGIGIGAGASTTLSNSTVVQNTAGSGGGISGGPGITLGSSIIAGNIAPTSPDISNTTVNSLGHNAISNATGVTITGTTAGNRLDSAASPLNLEGLANNGGLTQTVAIDPGSVAIGNGNCKTLAGIPLITIDQRGLTRKTPCDMGAYETLPVVTNQLDRVGLYNSNAVWLLHYTLTSSAATDPASFLFGGIAGAIPLAGDWNGDGIDTPGVYDPASKIWYLRNTNDSGSSDLQVTFPSSGGQPLVGDWNGDGTDTVGLYNANTGQWLLKNTNDTSAPDISFTWGGIPGAVAIVGDWNGDGTDTVGLYNPATGQWIEHSANATAGTDVTLIYGGIAGAYPLVGDWNGDGIDTPAMYVPTTAYWFFRNTNSTGFDDVRMVYGGISGYVPVVGHWSNTIKASAAELLSHQGNVLAPAAAVTPEATVEVTAEVISRQTNIFAPTDEVTPPALEITTEVTPEATDQVMPEATDEVAPVVLPTALPFPTLPPIDAPADLPTAVAFPTLDLSVQATGEVTPESTDQVTPEATDEILPTALPFPTLPPVESPTDLPTAQAFPTLPSPATPTLPPATPLPVPVLPPVSDSLDNGAADWAHTSGWTLVQHDSGLAWVMSSSATSEMLQWQQAVDLTAQPNTTLSFASQFVGSGSAVVIISTDSGANWQAIAAVPASNDWSTVTVDLGAYTGDVVEIGFLWQGNGSGLVDQWGVDDILIAQVSEAQPPTLAPTDTPVPTEAAPIAQATDQPSSTDEAAS